MTPEALTLEMAYTMGGFVLGMWLSIGIRDLGEYLCGRGRRQQNH